MTEMTSVVPQPGTTEEVVARPPPATSQVRKKPGPKGPIEPWTREAVARSVNFDKRSVSSVAKTFKLARKTVTGIAAAARGEAKHQPVRDRLTPKVAGDMPLDPFPPGSRPDLRDKKLSAEEKEYIAGLVNIQRRSVVSVSREFNLPTSSVAYFASKILRGEPMMRRCGNVQVIDEESQERLRMFADKEGADRPTREDMELILLEEIDKTKARRASFKRGTTKIRRGRETVSPASEGESASTEAAASRGDKGVSSRTVAKYLSEFGFDRWSK